MIADKRASILVVDDASENITIAANALADLYRVRAATSGDRALDMCQGEDPPDLVLLDVVMPELDGFEVCHQLKRDPRTADIPVIFVTGLSDSRDEQRGFMAGAVDFIRKPISVPIVRQRVALHLELAKARRDLQKLNAKFSRYLSPEVAHSLASGTLRAEVGNHRKKLTILFSDIVNFTHQTEALAPEDMTFVLNSYFAAMADIVAEHQGTFDKYIGDALMVFFGDPASAGPQQDARACVAMAVAMQRRVREMAQMWLDRGIASPLQVRIGVATGYCTVGNFGSPHKLEYTVMGGPVNLAARLESKATPGHVLVSEATYALVRDHFPLVPAEAMTLKGLPPGVGGYRVVLPDVMDSLVHDSVGASIRILPDGLEPDMRATLAGTLRRFADRLTS